MKNVAGDRRGTAFRLCWLIGRGTRQAGSGEMTYGAGSLVCDATGQLSRYARRYPRTSGHPASNRHHFPSASLSMIEKFISRAGWMKSP